MIRLVSSILLLIAVTAVSGCGPDYYAFESRTLGPPYGTTFVAVWVSDSPVDGAESVFVGFDRIELVGPEGIEVLVEGRQVYDLLTLQNGNRVRLAALDVPAQDYSFLRVVLAPEDAGINRIRIDGGFAPLVFTNPDGGTIELPLSTTFVEDGMRDLQIDINARMSVLEGGDTWFLDPQTTVVLPETAGSVAGRVTTLAAPPLASVTVSAQRGGLEFLSTRSGPDGSFRLTPLGVGVYDIVVTDVGHAPGVLAGVVVTEQQETAVSDVQLSAASPGTVGGQAPIGTATSVRFLQGGLLIGIAGVDPLTGLFYAPPLPPGTYDIELVGPLGSIVGSDPGVVLAPLGNVFVDFTT